MIFAPHRSAAEALARQLSQELPVAVADTEYRVGHGIQRVRPDELLQMFGRAGRRGRDTRGYTLVVPDKPRVHMASALKLRRVNQVDWPSILGVMAAAHDRGEDPLQAARKLTERLFSEQSVSLGLERFIARKGKNRLLQDTLSASQKHRTIEEFQNVDGIWERKRASVKVPLGKVLLYQKGKWLPALSVDKTLRVAGEGQVCLRCREPEKLYGREIPLATWAGVSDKKDIVLTKWLRKRLVKIEANNQNGRPVSRFWYYDPFERIILPQIPLITGGGKLRELAERNGTLFGRIDYSDAVVFANRDARGNYLLGAPRRERIVDDIGSFATHLQEQESGDMGGLSPTQAWFRLGLIDWKGNPTQRGRIFSFFNHGEGLAIAAALEEKSYEISELVFDVANLRAGHRFGEFESFSSRLGSVCQATYGNATFEGYLEKGLPSHYGEGAAEVLVRYEAQQGEFSPREGLLPGDVERIRLEWISLLRHINFAPDFEWHRWRKLQAEAQKLLFSREAKPSILEVPPLTVEQKQKMEHRLRIHK